MRPHHPRAEGSAAPTEGTRKTKYPKEALLRSSLPYTQLANWNSTASTLTTQRYLALQLKCWGDHSNISHLRREESGRVSPHSSRAARTGSMQRQIISRQTHHDTCATTKEPNNPEERKERSLRQWSTLWKQWFQKLGKLETTQFSLPRNETKSQRGQHNERKMLAELRKERSKIKL